MKKRHLVQIPPEQVQKLIQVDSIRSDMRGYAISKKVHILLQEKLKEIFAKEVLIPSEELKKGKWFEYIREQLPLHTIAPIMLGVARDSMEMIGHPFRRVMCANEDETKSWWANPKEDIYSMGNYLLKNFKDKNFTKKYYKKYNNTYDKTKKLMETLRNEDFSQIPQEKLLQKYLEFNDKARKFLSLTFDIDSIDICLEQLMQKKLKELMEKKGKFNKSIFNKNYSLLTTPTEMSFVNQEHMAIYHIAKKISQDKKLRGLFDYDAAIIYKKLKKNYPKLISEFKALVDKYWWTSLGWNDPREKTEKDYITHVKEVLKENLDINEEINRIIGFPDKIKKEKEILAEKLEFDYDMRNYLDIFEHYAVFHDWRKEGQMKCTNVMNKFLFEIARISNYKFTDLQWCWPWEIEDLIKTGRFDHEEIHRRQKSFFVIVSEQGIEQHTGEKARKRRREELDTNINNIQNFNGSIASAGKVIGKAKVCFSATDAIEKIQKGDILITSMTTPEYVPAMKKAGAIVTDEGGVTCHAAIISRELKIPCIVGTKIGTKILNDNDIIEVNANHGTVKLLNK